MAWVKVDDQFTDHPKAVEVGPLGVALWLAGMCYCNRFLTEGFIPAAAVPRLMHFEGLATHEEVVERLVAAVLWEPTEGGYIVHDYHDYQPSKEQVEAAREQRREAGKKGGLAKSKRNAKQTASEKPSESLSETPSKTQAKGVAKSYPGPVPVPSPLPQETDRPNGRAREEVAVATDDPLDDPSSVGLSDSGLEIVKRHYERHIGMIGPTQWRELSTWNSEHGMQAEVMCAAIDEAIKAGKRRCEYVVGILRNWYNDGIRTSHDLARASPKTPEDYENALLAQAAATREGDP